MDRVKCINCYWRDNVEIISYCLYNPPITVLNKHSSGWNSTLYVKVNEEDRCHYFIDKDNYKSFEEIRKGYLTDRRDK